jgi:hypothetical protein
MCFPTWLRCPVAAILGAVRPAPLIRVRMPQWRRPRVLLQSHSEGVAIQPMTADKVASAAGDAGGSVSIGKGAWDCDRGCKIPPEKEASHVENLVHCDRFSATDRYDPLCRHVHRSRYRMPPASCLKTLALNLYSRPERINGRITCRLRCLRRLPRWIVPSRAFRRCRRGRTWITWYLHSSALILYHHVIPQDANEQQPAAKRRCSSAAVAATG